MSNAHAISLITSAAFIDSELAAEFGALPPSFLPFGHRRLYEAQIDLLKQYKSRIAITLPKSFHVDRWDLNLLNSKSVEIIYLPDGLSLGESISHVLVLTDARGPVRLLHGDTLFLSNLGDNPDSLGVAVPTDVYDWGEVRRGGSHFEQGRPEDFTSGRVLSGWFNFSSAPILLRSLVKAQGHFLNALDLYAIETPLTPVETPEWLDFGHLQTFHRSRAKISTARSFNSLAVVKRSILKTGDNPRKLEAEASWFETIPPTLRLFTPHFLGRENGGYRLAYENNPTLQELFVSGRLEPAGWRKIIAGCFEFLQLCQEAKPQDAEMPDRVIERLSIDKTLPRLERWAQESGVSSDQQWCYAGNPMGSLSDIANRIALHITDSPPLGGVMHGDFCFSNIFFDFRDDMVKVIDPRGAIADEDPMPYGDGRYDLAKLNHSISGYDLILAGRYELTEFTPFDVQLHLENDGAADFIEQIAAEFDLSGTRINDLAIKALTIHLFLSMLPLHADRPDRQRAFIANALRLTSLLEAHL